MTTPSRNSDGAITLAEAAKQLRDQADSGKFFGRIANEHRALATLLDGDGEGGLLAGRDELTNALSNLQAKESGTEAENFAEMVIEASLLTLNRALTLVAACVSAVLGVEVEA